MIHRCEPGCVGTVAVRPDKLRYFQRDHGSLFDCLYLTGTHINLRHLISVMTANFLVTEEIAISAMAYASCAERG